MVAMAQGTDKSAPRQEKEARKRTQQSDFARTNAGEQGVDPWGLEPLSSAMRGRHESLQGFSGACKTPANGSILLKTHFLTFQDIYSGCCTVAAQPVRFACAQGQG